jgi:hypothetical protein
MVLPKPGQQIYDFDGNPKVAPLAIKDTIR